MRLSILFDLLDNSFILSHAFEFRYANLLVFQSGKVNKGMWV